MSENKQTQPYNYSDDLEFVFITESSALTAASAKHPDRNEDSLFVNNLNHTYMVADGVGSEGGSELASQIATSSIELMMQEAAFTTNPKENSEIIKEIIRSAHLKIKEVQEDSSIQTTATLLKIFDYDPNNIYGCIATVGDGRAYLLRNNELTQLTFDQGYFSDPNDPDAKDIQEKLSNVKDESELEGIEKFAFKHRNVIRGALGQVEPLKVDIVNFEIEPRDKILLTTDGIHDNLTNYEIESILSRHETSEAATKELLEKAKERSTEGVLRSKKDDMSAVAIFLI